MKHHDPQKTWTPAAADAFEKMRQMWHEEPLKLKERYKGSPLAAMWGKDFFIAAYPIGFQIELGGGLGRGGWGAVAFVDPVAKVIRVKGANPAADPVVADLVIALAQVPELADLRIEGAELTYPDALSATRDVKEVEHRALVRDTRHDEPRIEVYKYRVLRTVQEHDWHHATRSSKMPSIVRRGLLPSASEENPQGEGWTRLNLHLQSAVYLTADANYAEQIAATLAERFEESAVVLKINPAVLDLSRLVPDEDALRDDFGTVSWTNTNPNYPSFIEGLTHSVRGVGFVGVIPPEALAVVGELSAPVYEPVIDWRTDEPTGEAELVGGLEWTPAT